MFILELTLRSWNHTEENKRTPQKNDIAAAITRTDIFDFLVDIVPREDLKDEALASIPRGTVPVGGPTDAYPYYYMPAQHLPQGGAPGMIVGQPVMDPVFIGSMTLGSSCPSKKCLDNGFCCSALSFLNLYGGILCLWSVLGIILGGGAGTRLDPLTKKRKPAVPLGANYHLIDIPVSNCLNSNKSKIYVLTQFNSVSLNRHLSQAYANNMGGYKNEGFVEVLAAQQSPKNPNWFQVVYNLNSKPSSLILNQNRLRDFIKQTLLVETKSRGRQELPSDLFTASHLSFPAPVRSWQVQPPYGMGYGMQYHPTTMSVPAFPNSVKSRNPFDLNDDNNQAQGPMPQASSYGSIPPSQIPSSGMSPSPGAFMGQQFPSNMPFPSFKALEMTDLFKLFFQASRLVKITDSMQYQLDSMNLVTRTRH
ncbi:hypothetical protein ACSBR1_018561 [Camellia fascicularis]